MESEVVAGPVALLLTTSILGAFGANRSNCGAFRFILDFVAGQQSYSTAFWPTAVEVSVYIYS